MPSPPDDDASPLLPPVAGFSAASGAPRLAGDEAAALRPAHIHECCGQNKSSKCDGHEGYTSKLR